MLHELSALRYSFRCLLILAGLGLVIGVSSGEAIADGKSEKSTEARSEVERLMKLVESDDLQIRANAIVELGKLGGSGAPAAQLLVEQLSETTQKVTVGRWTAPTAHFASSALTLIGIPAAPAVIQGLSHKNDDVRQKAASILGSLKYEPAIDVLVELLGDENRTVAGAASSALKRIGAPASDRLLKVLVDGLKIPAPAKEWKDGEHPNPDDPLTLPRQQRNYAAGVLGQLDDPRAIEPLLKAFELGDRLFLRWTGGALSGLKSEECQDVISRKDIVLRLIELLKTDDLGQRNDIVRVLQNVTKEGRDPLLAALEGDDRRVRVSLLRVWQRFRDDDRIIPIAITLISADKGDDKALLAPLVIQERRMAINILSERYFRELDSREPVLSLLLDQLKDPSGQVRAAAAHRLADIPNDWKLDPRVLSELLIALETRSDESTRRSVIYALGEIGDPKCVMPLAQLLTQPEMFDFQGDTPRDDLPPKSIGELNDAIRTQICKALIELNDKRAIPLLRSRRALNEPFVLEALGKLGDVDSLPVLLRQLKSESHDDRLAAAKALQGTPDSRAVKPLAEALKLATGGSFTNRNVSSKSQLTRELSLALAATFEPEAAEILVTYLRTSSLDIWAISGHYWYQPPLAEAAARHPHAYSIVRMSNVAIPSLIKELQLPHKRAEAFQNAEGSSVQQASTRTSREVSAWALKQLVLESEISASDFAGAESVLIAALDIDEPGLQLHAATALGRMKSEAALPDLLELLEACATESEGVTDQILEKADAARRAFNSQPEQNLNAEKLRDSVELLVATVNALSWLGENSSVSKLEALLTHGVADVREAAIYGIVSGRHKDSAQLIVPMLKDSASKVRRTAARQLGFLGETDSVLPLLNLLATEAQRPKPVPPKNRNGILVLNSSQPDARFRVMSMAAQSLGMLGDMQASDALFELTSQEDIELRAHAVLALVHLGDKRGIDAFRAIVTGNDKRLRNSVLTRARLVGWLSENTACPKFTSPAAQKLFRDLTLNAAEDGVRGRAASLLTGKTNAETISCLMKACADKSDFVRYLAVRSLMKTTEPDRFKTLNSFLADASPQCRRTAIELTESLHSETDPPTDSGPSISNSVSAVAPLLRDDDASVRRAAIRSLSKFHTQAPKQVGKHTAAIQRLTHSDSDRTIRLMANRLLNQIEE